MLILIALAAQAAATEPAQTPPVRAAQPAQCQALAARIAELKAETRRAVGDAPGRADALASKQAVVAGTAVAGNVVAQLGGGIIGHAITEGALQVQKQQTASAMRSTQEIMARTLELAREIHKHEKERKPTCGGTEVK